MKKKFFAMLMAVVLCVGMLPTGVLADVGDPTEVDGAEQETADADENSDIVGLAYSGTAYDVVFTTSNESGAVTGNYNGGSRATVPASSLAGYAESDGSITITLPADADLANNTGNIVTIYEPGDMTVELNGIDGNGYNYKLEGWYNLGSGDYYEAGSTATINLSDRNIFYADYYANSYNVGYDNGDTADSVSTDFVDIELFDYNELFNLYSANVEESNIGEVFSDSTSLYASPAVLDANGTGHDADSTGISSFLFKYNSVGTSNIFYPSNMANWNEWVNGYNLKDASSVWGINSSSYTDNALLNQLFNPGTDALGVKYIGSADYLFQYGTEDNGAPDEYVGYYYYSSNLNSVAYNQDEGRFYVYNEKEVYDDDHNMFLPFQNHDTYEKTSDDLNINYLFGMSMEVDFYLPNAVNGEDDETQENGVGNVDENGNDLKFSYSGDDDILVFVDDDLVLDMSGIHLEADGSINFNKGTYEKSNVTEGPGGTINLSAGSHKLTVYYLERGTGYSNLTVCFNVVPQWHYESADVQTIEASKVWVDADGNVIEDTADLPDVNVGLYAALGEDEYDTESRSYHFTDDKNRVHSFTYSDSGYTHSIDGTEVESSTTKDDDGRFVDENGWVLAWMDDTDGEKLYVRVDVQVLNEENAWEYAWEMRNPEESYIVLEMENDGYTLKGSNVDDNIPHYYWTIIGEAEIEGGNTDGNLLNQKLILTDGAQHKTRDETLGDTQEAVGWVLVADANGTLTAEEVTFSQIGTQTHENSDTGEESGDWYGTYGVTTVGQIDALGDGAVWYMEDANDKQDDTTGEKIEAFYLYCVVGGNTYYLTTGGGETTLAVTNNKNYAREFYYDSLGELRVVLESGDTRVAIDNDGNITLEPAAEIAETSDVRVYTLSEITSNSYRYIFKNEPDQPEDPTKSYNEDTEAGADGTDVKIGDEITYDITYYNHNGKEATVTISDVLDDGFDFVEASDGGTYDADSRTVTWTLEEIPANSGGKVTLTVEVNEDAFEIVENQASVAIGDDPAVDTNILENPVPEDEEKSVDVGDGTAVKVGDELEYTITFYNDSEEEVEVTVTDTLDNGLTYVDASASDSGAYDDATRTITWTVTLAAYSEGKVTFKATVNEDAFEVVENTAQVQYGDNSDVKTTNKVENPVPEDPTKSVDTNGDEIYTDDGVEVRVGDELTYNITYYNQYSTEATVTITDVLDEGLDFVSATNGGTYDEATRTITWTIENAPAYKEGSVTFTATVNESALFENEVDNTATVQVGDDPTVDTNKVENPVEVSEKDVNIGDGTETKVGDELIYTISYKNGHSTVADVTITDVLDEGLDFVYASNGGTYDEATRTVTWEIPNVHAYTEGSVSLIVKVNENALTLDKVTNTASVQVGDDPSVETNEVVNPLEDPEDPAKGVEIGDTEDGEEPDYDDSGREVSVGDTLTYEITYKNGHSEAAVVTITDVLDVGLDFVSATDGGIYDETTHTITWILEDVEAYTEGSVTFTATVNSDAVVKDEVDNTASVQIGDDPAVDTNKVENPVDEPEDSTKGVDVGDGTEVQVGDELTYVITYKNEHSTEADVTITDVLDAGLDFVSASDGGTYDEATRTVTWTFEGVEAYASGSVELVVTVNETALVIDEVTNTASVQYGDVPAVETNEVMNPVDETEVPVKSVEIGDTEEGEEPDFDDNGKEVSVGDELTYEITYKNGHGEAATVIIRDVLDEGLDLVSATEGGTYDEDTRTITWVIEDVEAYTDGSVTFTATVNEDALIMDEVTNTASVQVGDDPAVDTNAVENPVEEPEDSTKDVNVGDGTEVKVGDTIVYEIGYKNGHSVAADVTIRDELDEGLDFVYATNGGTYDASTHTVTWTFTNVAAYAEGSVWLTVVVNENALIADEVTNTASVQIGDDPDCVAETNTVYNPLREYFPIDEEIVPDENDRDSWVKNEAVNEYNAIELEMSTFLPIIDASELETGEFTMNFHDVLDSELVLDEVDADFSVYIGGNQISHDYYVVTLESSSAEPARALSLGDPITDGCSFHVDVDLTKLYKDGILTEDDLTGNTEIMIFFYADLEGTDLNGSYKSTVWYEVYDGDELQYISNEDVVEVYTYEIYIEKYDSETGETLAGATLGVCYDPDCTESVSRNGEPYTAESGEDGAAIFYGLADGTYYVTELEAPEGYVLSDEVLEVVLNEDLADNNYMYVGEYANTPEEPGPTPTPDTVDVNGSKIWDDNDDAEGKRPESIKIHLYADGKEIDSADVTAEDGWTWSFTDLDKYDADGKEIAYTITEDAVEGYDTTYVGSYNVTNTYNQEEANPDTVSIPVTKVWNDDDDLEGLRPTSVVIELYKNGESTSQVLVLNEENSWSGSFDDLDEYNEGTKNVYTIEEQEVGEYISEIMGDAETGFIVTNTFNPAAATQGPGPETDGGTYGGTGTTGSAGGTGGTGGTGSTGGTGGTGGTGSTNSAGTPSTTSSAGTAKTGDTGNAGPWLVLLVLAGACVVGSVTVRTRKTKQRRR